MRWFWELFLGNFVTARLHISLTLLSFCPFLTLCAICSHWLWSLAFLSEPVCGTQSPAPKNKACLWRRASLLSSWSLHLALCCQAARSILVICFLLFPGWSQLSFPGCPQKDPILPGMQSFHLEHLYSLRAGPKVFLLLHNSQTTVAWQTTLGKVFPHHEIYSGSLGLQGSTSATVGNIWYHPSTPVIHSAPPALMKAIRCC